ncbi:MAG: peptidylprolyl isomerase [Anaeromyxobacteraceae bacterium]|nr:peptidylprolyl isomerase [Anaeromyxobacteraceae bacterium]
MGTAIIAAASFFLGRATAPDGLVAKLARRGEQVAAFTGGALGTDEAREVIPAGATKEHAKAAVEALVRTRVLAARAEDARLHLSPSFLHRYAEELAGLYVTERFEKPFEKQLPSDDEVKRFFEENRARLGRLERVRLAHLALDAPRGDQAARGRRRAEALSLLAELRRSRADEYAFSRLAMSRSEDAASRAMGGELPFLTREEAAQRLGPEVAAVVFASSPAGLLEAPVETERGFQLVKVLAREAGREADFAELRDTIRNRMTQERHDTALRTFLDAAWTGASVKLDEQMLDRLVAESRSRGPKQSAKPGTASR